MVLTALSCPARAQTVSTEIQPGIPEDWKLAGPAASVSNLGQAAQKYKGVFPLQVKYSFKDEQNGYVFVEKKLKLPGQPVRIRGSVYGDGSGNTLRANFTDSSGEFFQGVAAKIDWNGWKDVETDLVLGAHWEGDNNGKMDGDVFFHSWAVNIEPKCDKTKGEIALASMIVVSEAAAQKGAPTEQADRVVIDDFERPNPLSVYQTWRGDDSSVDSVSSAEFKKEGNYSMQVVYSLVTARSEPSWVSLSFAAERPLDWSRVEELKFWVKGDGTKNILQISLLDDSNTVWIYRIPDALKNVDWQNISVALGDFRDRSGRNRYVPGKVRQYEIAVLGEQTQNSSGKFWMDELAALGQGLDPLMVSPRPPVTLEETEKVKVGFGDFVHMEYRQTPEKSQQFLFYNSLIVKGTAKRLSLAADLVSEQNEAGSSIGFIRPAEKASGQKDAPTEVKDKPNPIQLKSLTASMHDLHPHISKVTIGNVNIDYGRDVFSPVFGFKGIEAEGRVTPVHYDAFILKHAFDAATFGYRLQGSYWDTLMKYEMVQHRDTAKALSNAQVQNGQLVVSADATSSSVLKTEPVGSDSVYYFEADRDFLMAFNLNASFGMDFFERNADKDVSDFSNPVIKEKLAAPVSLYGRMWQVRGKILPGALNDGFSLIGSYRDFSAEFKPRFRFDPGFYDDAVADQRGYKFELTQIMGKSKFIGIYDSVRRGPETSGYRRWSFQGSLGYYNLNRMDVVFSLTKRREFYALGENHLRSTFFINPADPRDEEAEAYDLFLGNWFSNAFYVWCKLSYEDIRLVRSARKLRNDRFQIQGEYAFTSNSKLLLSVIQRRFNNKTDEPVGGDPPTDNVVRLFLDINF